MNMLNEEFSHGLCKLIENTLSEIKAVDVKTIPLQGKADFADFMIVASGTSDRHLHAMSDKIIEETKKAGFRPLGVEGEDSRDWVLVDMGDIIVHLMRPETRELYALEKLWSLSPSRSNS